MYLGSWGGSQLYSLKALHVVVGGLFYSSLLLVSSCTESCYVLDSCRASSCVTCLVTEVGRGLYWVDGEDTAKWYAVRYLRPRMGGRGK